MKDERKSGSSSSSLVQKLFQKVKVAFSSQSLALIRGNIGESPLTVWQLFHFLEFIRTLLQYFTLEQSNALWEPGYSQNHHSETKVVSQDRPRRGDGPAKEPTTRPVATEIHQTQVLSDLQKLTKFKTSWNAREDKKNRPTLNRTQALR
jgi:hypothetical protein